MTLVTIRMTRTLENQWADDDYIELNEAEENNEFDQEGLCGYAAL